MRALLLAALVLAASAAAQLPGSTWTSALEAAAPSEALVPDAPGGNATADVLVRYTVAGGLCSAGRAPVGTAAITLALGDAGELSATTDETPRAAPLACGTREETFPVTVRVPVDAAPGRHEIPLEAAAEPTCTGPCGLVAQTASATLRVDVPALDVGRSPPLTLPPGNVTVEPASTEGAGREDPAAGAPGASPLLFVVPVVAGLVAVVVVVAIVGRLSR